MTVNALEALADPHRLVPHPRDVGAAAVVRRRGGAGSDFGGARDVVVVHKTRGHCQDQRDCIGVGDVKRGTGTFGTAAFETGNQRRLESKAFARSPRDQATHAARRSGERAFPSSVHDETVATGNALYVGGYSLCCIPGFDGPCLKVAFPLPNGYALVILKPESNPDGSLTVRSAGRRFGDPGFYFYVEAQPGRGWARYVASLKESIHLFRDTKGELRADHHLGLWGVPFLIAGIYLIFGRFFHDAAIRKRLSYAVTDQRTLVLKGLSSAKLKSLDIDRLPKLELSEHGDGTGTIEMEGDSSFFGSRMNGFGYWTPALSNATQFFRIDQPRKVYELIRDQPRSR